MTDPKSQAAIDSVLREERVFPPPSEFSRHAHVPDRARYDALYFCTFGLTWSVSKRFALDAAYSGGESCELPER